MRKSILLAAALCIGVLALWGCGASDDKGEEAVGCTSKEKAACVATSSNSGYGKCIWGGGACAEPTAESSCATYTDEESCTQACTWADGACSGPTGGSGLECAEYTTQEACEVPCGWLGSVCGVDPCSGKEEAACTTTASDNGYGNCIWEAGACAAPTVESSCATYSDEASCTAACTWADGACSGPTGGSGLECAEYTTQEACEIPCGWDGTACVVEE